MIHLYYTLIAQQSGLRAMRDAQRRAGRLLLCGALGISEGALAAALRYHENGKPYLPGGPYFNISHSGRMVLLAVSGAAEIGCDVEALSRRVHNEAAIRRKIAEPGAEDIPLLELWVRYEARLKAGGPGRMYMPPVRVGYVAAVCSLAEHACELAIEEKYFA